MTWHKYLIAIIVKVGIVFAVITITIVYLLEIYFGFGIYMIVGIINIIIGLYFLLPIIYHFSPFIQRHVIFLNVFQWSFGQEYFDPRSHNVSGARNFYLIPQSGVTIGVWQILPKSRIRNDPERELYWERELKESENPIVIYLHGNMGTRATGHRIDLYQRLQEHDYHVIAFDYRRFADSKSIVPPTESGLVADSKCVYEWLREILGNESTVPVFLWGHSLGTGVAVHLASNLCTKSKFPSPDGIILEAPFTKLEDVVLTSISSIIFRPLPGRKWLLTSPLKKNDLAFETDLHILNVDIPILIFHDPLDMVVPYQLGKKLYETACSAHSKNSKSVFLKTFKGNSRSSAHVRIWNEAELMDNLSDFLSYCRSYREESEL